MHRRTPRDLQTEAYYIESSREVPVDLALMAGDALQNLRSALDHLIYQAIFKQTNVWPTKRTIAFPIGKDSNELPPPKFGGKVDGLGKTGNRNP
jgi:hypothetical protein